mgnify:CR=1 FL=1|jgi:diguanylate cyclase (GGDEF)-like protein
MLSKEAPTMNTPHLAYMITEGYCFLYGATVLFRMNSNIGSQKEIRELRNMIYSYFGMLIFDILSYLLEDGILPQNGWLSLFFGFFTIISICFGCYFWFRYIDTRLHLKYEQNVWAQLLLAVPLVFIVVADFVSLFTGWLFYVDDVGSFQTTDAFTWVQGSVNYFYLVIPTAASLVFAFKTKSHLERGEYWTYAAYMVAPLLAGILEDYLPTVPILALNIFLLIHILFLMIQNMQIYNDALTNLNNRRHLNGFLEERLPRASAEHPVYFFIIDINGFKAINDAYGHVEGDNALTNFADLLRREEEKYHAFAARYGGDEFALVADGANINPDKIIADLEKSVAESPLFKKQDPSKPSFSISVGFTKVNEPENDINLVIARADRMLYIHKQQWHRQHS